MRGRPRRWKPCWVGYLRWLFSGVCGAAAGGCGAMIGRGRRFVSFPQVSNMFVVVGLSSFSGRSGRNTWSDANDSLAERQPDCVVCVSLSTAELGEIQAGAEIGSVLNPVGIIRPRTRLESHQRPRRRSIFPCTSFGSGLSAESLSSLRVTPKRRTRRRSRRSHRRSWRARPRRCPRRRAVTDRPARVEETDEPAGRFPLRLGLSVR